MRIVSLDNLTDDMELARPVYRNEIKLLNSGVERLTLYRDQLARLGINYLYIHDQYSQDIEIEQVIREETRRQSESAIRHVFNSITSSGEFNARQVTDTVSSLMNDILSSNDTLANLFYIKEYDKYTYSHSVNVAVISMLLAQMSGLSQSKVSKLGEGAILHDIGKMQLPEAIIKKNSSLTPEEYAMIREHPRLGYNYLKENDYFSPLSRIVVLSHHERVDGSGYPRGLAGNDIHLFGRIVALADVFDALVSDRPYRQKWTIKSATEYLIANADIQFDYELVQLFCRRIVIYPDGIKVRFTSGQEGVVLKQNIGYPSRPVVRIIRNESGQYLSVPQEVDLLSDLELEIEDALV